MRVVTIRRSHGADIISLPRDVSISLGLHAGKDLELAIVDNSLVLTPVWEEEIALEAILDASPRECFQINECDREWLDGKPSGREI